MDVKASDQSSVVVLLEFLRREVPEAPHTQERRRERASDVC
jgi:hypothetical protein